MSKRTKVFNTALCKSCGRLVSGRKGTVTGSVFLNGTEYDIELAFCQLCFIGLVNYQPRTVISEVELGERSII